MTLREGRNRQVRRMCEAVGHPVVTLARVQFGPLRDPGLKVGHSRELTPSESQGAAGVRRGHHAEAAVESGPGRAAEAA